MNQDGYEPGPSSGERWNVNLPLVIGVVFVALLGVIIWVVASGGDEAAAPTTPPVDPALTSSTTTVALASTTSTAAATTTPAPMPSTSVPAPTTEPEPTTPPATPAPTAPAATTPVTADPGAGPGAVPGDLGVPGTPMVRPPCDGAYITILASAVGDQATAGGIGAVIDQYPGSNYLRTDQTCSSLNPAVDGQPIYVVFLGPFAFDSDACQARAAGPDGAYARQLSNDIGPDHAVDCP
jgi:serine/threonine-protein kinase